MMMRGAVRRSEQPSERGSRTQAGTIDKTIVLAVVALMLTSLVAIFATTYLYNQSGSWRETILQLIWFMIGGVLATLAVFIDRETWYRIAPIGYGVGIALLVLVLFFYSREIQRYTGAKSWFMIGRFSFQPSELMKFLYLLMMARLVSEYNTRSVALAYADQSLGWQLWWDFKFLVRLSLWTALPIVLIILQNDFGTMLVFLMMFVGLVFISGVNWRLILPVALGLALLFGTLLFFVIYDREPLYQLGFQEYQFARIDSWLRPFDNTREESYQLSQSLKAIGSGRFTGKGFGQFDVYVPVRVSDMIFSTIGENFGFIGASLVVLVFFILLFQMIAVAYATYDSFWVSGVTAIVAMLTFHIVENIGMSVGLLPLTGIPLPFISQGGSAILMNMLCIGFVLSISFNDGVSDQDIEKRPLTRLLRFVASASVWDRLAWRPLKEERA